MTRTITETDAMKLTLPAQPGLLDGYIGPIQTFNHVSELGHPDRVVIQARGQSWPGYWRDTIYPVGREGFAERLPLARWECRARVAQWLAEGQKCQACAGKGDIWEHWRPPETQGAPCDRCKGTGYLRQPSPVWDFLDGPGKVELWVSAALLWASALRAVAGMGPIVGCFAPWHDTAGTHARDGLQEYSSVFVSRTAGDFPGWSVNKSRVAFGLETGDEGKAKADEAALKAGFALMGDNGQTITVEVPE